VEAQQKVRQFIEEHDMEAKPEFRIMDLMAEVGEIAGDAAKSTDYGLKKDNLNVKNDEVGDALFSLLSICEEFDIDADEALEESLQKYKDRIEEKGDPGSR